MADTTLLSLSYQLPSFRVRNAIEVKNWIINVITDFGFEIDTIGFVFCDDDFLLNLNVSHLNHDTLTDVITFDYSVGRRLSGEIYISYERIKANSKLFKVTLQDELHRVMIHGVLHLIGYKDYTLHQKSEMTDKENYCLSLRAF